MASTDQIELVKAPMHDVTVWTLRSVTEDVIIASLRVELDRLVDSLGQ